MRYIRRLFLLQQFLSGALGQLFHVLASFILFQQRYVFLDELVFDWGEARI